MEDIVLSTGARARLVLAPEAVGRSPTLLVLHGWKGDAVGNTYYNKVAEMLNGVGYHCLLVTLRGHGSASGEIEAVTRGEHLADIHMAVDYLYSRPEVDTSELGAYGSSYGAYLLAIAAGTLRLKRLALRAPALYPDSGWDTPIVAVIDDPGLRAFRLAPHGPEDCRALEGIAQCAGDILIIASEFDENMPPSVARSYIDAVRHERKKLIVLQGAGHQPKAEDRAKLMFILEEWFRNRFPAPRL